MVNEFNGNIIDGVYFFYSGWAGKCNYINDRINRISKKYPNINVIKVNTTKYMGLKKQFLIQRIPTFIYIKNYKEIKRIEGNVDYITLNNWLEKIGD